jgi:hypothetical protein
MIRAALAAIALMLSGCVVTPTTGVSGVHYYVGVVRVEIPKATGRLVMVDTKVLGLGFDGSAFLGWREGQFVFARPEDCRLVVVVRDAAERPHIETLVRSLGEGTCIAGSSPRSPSSPGL